VTPPSSGRAREPLERRGDNAARVDGVGQRAAVGHEGVQLGRTDESSEPVEHPFPAPQADQPVVGQRDSSAFKAVYHRPMNRLPDPEMRRINPANRLGLDYAAEAGRLGSPPAPMIDVHTHVNGPEAARIYKRVADLYGITLTYSMSKLEELDVLREVLDGRIRFIAVPDYWDQENRRYAMTDGFIRRIEAYHTAGSRIAKFWVAPRSTDYAIEMGDPTLMRLDAPPKIEAMQVASDLGMIFMTHVADPDTWFETRYADASVYGTKREQYEPFEAAMQRFTQPWIAAHMGGWPEDLEFLTGLLDRHSNLYLDTSATKWMVRELSRHSRDELLAFLTRFKGRILFGSDIVTADEHLRPAEDEHEMYQKASNASDAFDLYASRYWALRTMFERAYEGESPIADPDLAMVDPDRHDGMSAPRLVGRALPRELLISIYHEAAHVLLEPYHSRESSTTRYGIT
jgi:hypothetical protein